jgi:hypothetical protein
MISSTKNAKPKVELQMRKNSKHQTVASQATDLGNHALLLKEVKTIQ